MRSSSLRCVILVSIRQPCKQIVDISKILSEITNAVMLYCCSFGAGRNFKMATITNLDYNRTLCEFVFKKVIQPVDRL
jgi:hypothetical protein